MYILLNPRTNQIYEFHVKATAELYAYLYDYVFVQRGDGR
jgi:hypothetical protein